LIFYKTAEAFKNQCQKEYLAEKLADNHLESISEVPGKEGVDKGIDGRVAVA
jgi:hypothetical protein